MAEIDFILNTQSKLILENTPKKYKDMLHLSHTVPERWDVPSLHHHNLFHYKSTSPSQPISLHRIRDVIESAPPLKVGEEREINSFGLKKNLLKRGQGGESWDTPEFGDEITVHYVDTLLDGSKLHSTRDNDKPYNFKLGYGLFVGFCYFEGILIFVEGPSPW